jgi:epoxyqueuosine reductase
MTQAELAAKRTKEQLKIWAHELGFASLRVSRAAFLEDEAPKLESWLKENRHGKMAYMANHFDKRLDPRKLLEGTQSLITLVFNYFPENETLSQSDFKISRYAYGEDYHKVLKSKLKTLWRKMEENIGQVEGRIFVDSAPLMEKAWASRNGSGWLGKHTNIMHPKMGSYFFLCEMLVDFKLEPDPPMPDHCGTCTRCIDACPTDAITAPYQLDASKCISYLTIELKEAIPAEFKNQMENWAFGCDICQEVCPWNHKFSLAHQETAFQPKDELLAFSRQDWLEITEEVFGKIFEKSALKRTGFQGLKRNIQFIESK